jgi:hypothetical protein
MFKFKFNYLVTLNTLIPDEETGFARQKNLNYFLPKFTKKF